MNAFKLWIAPGLLVGLLGACASPSPAPVLLTLPPALGIASTTAAPSAPAASMPLLAVRRVGIPEYLVARRVRYRADAATLAEWPNTYWAERIEIGVSREFVSALRRQLPGWAICEANCGDHRPALTLQVDLALMDFVRSAHQLQARARITVGGAGVPDKVLETKEMSVDIPATADTAQAHAQTISTLIEKLAAEAAPMIRNARP